MSIDFRPCSCCGSGGVRPPAAFSTIVDSAAKQRGWSDNDLAAATDLSPGYVWRLRRADKVVLRPSSEVCRRLVAALELTGSDADLVQSCGRDGVGLDRAGDAQ